MISSDSFSPLIGVIISKPINEAHTQWKYAVSVPLSGLLFLNLLPFGVQLTVLISFSPLIGVIISKQIQLFRKLIYRFGFQSPYRGYYF